MAGRLLLVALVPVGLLLVLTVFGRAAAAAHLEGTAKGARRRSVVATALTALAGTAALVLWPMGDREQLDVRLATLPAIAALAAVLVSAVSELTWPRPTGTRRVASLSARQMAAPTVLLHLFWTSLAAIAGLLALGALTAAPDGRSVERHWATGGAGHGPYPGLHYTPAVGVAVGALALATIWALRRVEARPSLGADMVEVDRAVRRASQIRILRGAVTGGLLTAAGLALSMGTALNGVTQTMRMNRTDTFPQPPFDWTQNAGFALIALGVAFGLATLLAVFWPSPRVQAEPRPLSDAAVA